MQGAGRAGDTVNSVEAADSKKIALPERPDRFVAEAETVLGPVLRTHLVGANPFIRALDSLLEMSDTATPS